VERFGEAVRRRRLRAGLTQEELAHRTGLSVRGLRKLEAGDVGDPRPHTVRVVAAALGVDHAEWPPPRAAEQSPVPGREGFSWPRPRQLPAENPRAACAERDLRAIDQVIDPGPPVGVPTVLVCGPPQDATALLLRWAHRAVPRYPDGQLFGRLRGSGGGRRPPGPVLRGFLQALGVPTGEIPGPIEHAAALYRSLLYDRRTLVVLSDVVDAEQVGPLLPGGPGPAVLLTCPEDPALVAAALGAVTVAAAARAAGDHVTRGQR
jgi:transcriptional regulator with XRE-family HTH domain